MAKLVAVCRSDDYQFGRRQIPLVVDDTLTLVVQFNDTCIGCEMSTIKKPELERFVARFDALTKDEIATALMVTSKEILNLLSQMVPCVGCRRSVERLFKQLVHSGYPALEPLIVTSLSCLSINRNYLFDPKAIYALFYVHGSKLNTMMESIPKSKKNKRCVLHSLDNHKTKPAAWMETWELLSHDCREEVVLIDTESLITTLESYLRKHRFCSECKSKVMRAYNILIGEVDSLTEKGFCPALYDGLRCCPQEKHLHVLCETEFIAHLIGRAEPELSGSRRERHAKTLDIAQEEVLTCLGIHLYDRIHKVSQKLRGEEQTWQILFYLGVEALKKNFEVALERKQGITNLELMCQELLEEEQAKQQKKEQKRQKRKKKKNKGNADEKCNENDCPTTNCTACEFNEQHSRVSTPKKKLENSKNTPVTPCQHDGNHSPGYGNKLGKVRHRCSSRNYSPESVRMPLKESVHVCCESPGLDCPCDNKSSRSDCGYSSGLDGCDSCSTPSSRDGSDVACHEGICNHEGDVCLCSQPELPTLYTRPSSYDKSCGMKCCGQGKGVVSFSNGGKENGQQTGTMTFSLQDMLEEPCLSGDEGEEMISEEEIRSFKANQQDLSAQRQQLREKLRQRFSKWSRCSPSCRADCSNCHADCPNISKLNIHEK